jgi:hypothetical protein
MKTNFVSIFLLLLLGVSIASHADTNIYNYTSPAMSSGDYLVATFTKAAKLAANKSYVTSGTAVDVSITID